MSVRLEGLLQVKGITSGWGWLGLLIGAIASMVVILAIVVLGNLADR